LNEVLIEDHVYIERIYPYDQMSKLTKLRNYGRIVSEEYLAEGVSIKAYVPMDAYNLV